MWGLVMCLCFGTATGASLGYNAMLIATLSVLPQYQHYFQLNDATTGLNTATAWIGNLLSCFFTQYFCDKYGRKPVIILGNLIALAGVVIMSSAQNEAMFAVGTIIMGFGSQSSNISSSILVGESIPASIRGFGLGLCFTGFTIGGFLSICITYGSRSINSTWAWRIPCILQLFPVLLSTLIIFYQAESPRWLISKDRINTAQQALARVYTDHEQLDKEVEEIMATICYQDSQLGYKFFELFKGKANLHRLMIIFSLGLISELAGSGVNNYYFGRALDLVGIVSFESQLQALICIAAWTVITSLVGSATYDKFGRKIQYFWSMMGMTAILIVLGALMQVYGSENEGMLGGSWASIVIMFISQGLVGFALLPMITIYPAEIYPFEMRASGTALSILFNCGFGLLSTFVLPLGMQNLGFKFYYLNAGYNVIFLITIYFLWVETKGKPLEKIAELFEGKKKELALSIHSLDTSSTQTTLVGEFKA